MISVAASVGASTLAANQASTLFRNSLVVVKTFLTEEEQEWINRDRKCVYFFNTLRTEEEQEWINRDRKYVTRKSGVAHENPYLAACREIIRRDFHQIINLKTTSQRVLILGASVREYKQYNNNKYVSFQFANVETKDVERTIMSCLEGVRNIKLRKVTKNIGFHRNSEDLKTVDEAIKEWKLNRTVPDKIIFWDDVEKLKAKKVDYQFDILGFDDAGYNFTAKDWGEFFRMTGAVSALGYMCLPLQLIQPDIISPPGYAYCKRGEYSYLGYHGYSDDYTYMHRTDTWKTLMAKCALQFGDFNLGVEFMSRVGPMTLIRITKTTAAETIVRHLEVPDYLKTTLILDVPASFDRSRCELKLHDLKYFGVKTSEFDDAVNYGLGIAKESMSYSNILLFICRSCSGLSLITKQVSKTWTISAAKIPAFASVVYLYVMYLCKDFVKFQELAKDNHFTPFLIILRKQTNFIRESFKDLYNYLCHHNLFYLLVKDVAFEFWQKVTLKKFKSLSIMVNTGVGPEGPYENKFDIVEPQQDGNLSDCHFCVELKEVCGEQLFTCQRDKDEEFFHNFSLTDSELTHFRNTLADTSGDVGGLKKVKEEALRNTPMSPFSNTVNVRYLCGPPGSGKSYIVRALATKQDLVLAPFSRLKDDYTNFVHPVTNVRCSLKFHTQHSGLKALNYSRIFVDEFTAMPYECLAVIVNNCGAEEVILVGDLRQTSIVHGISIETKIDVPKMRAHELIKNDEVDCPGSKG